MSAAASRACPPMPWLVARASRRRRRHRMIVAIQASGSPAASSQRLGLVGSQWPQGWPREMKAADRGRGAPVILPVHHHELDAPGLLMRTRRRHRLSPVLQGRPAGLAAGQIIGAQQHRDIVGARRRRDQGRRERFWALEFADEKPGRSEPLLGRAGLASAQKARRVPSSGQRLLADAPGQGRLARALGASDPDLMFECWIRHGRLGLLGDDVRASLGGIGRWTRAHPALAPAPPGRAWVPGRPPSH